MSPLSNALPTPAENECIRCYLERTIETASCDGTLRAVAHYQEHRKPSENVEATAYIPDFPAQLKSHQVACDCEYRMNQAYQRYDARRTADGKLNCAGMKRPYSIIGCTNWRDRGPWAAHEREADRKA